MLIVLRFSKHICINAGLTFLQCLSFLCSVLCFILILPLRLYEHYAAYGEAYQAKPSCVPSHYFQSKAWIMSTQLPHFFQNIIELPSVWNDVLLLLLIWTLNLLVCFEECINRRDWHQRAFHWVPKKRAPLKIARLLL